MIRNWRKNGLKDNLRYLGEIHLRPFYLLRYLITTLNNFNLTSFDDIIQLFYQFSNHTSSRLLILIASQGANRLVWMNKYIDSCAYSNYNFTKTQELGGLTAVFCSFPFKNKIGYIQFFKRLLLELTKQNMLT